MEIDHILAKLRSLARPDQLAGMARYGVGDRPGALKLWEQASVLFEQIDFPFRRWASSS